MGQCCCKGVDDVRLENKQIFVFVFVLSLISLIVKWNPSWDNDVVKVLTMLSLTIYLSFVRLENTNRLRIVLTRDCHMGGWTWGGQTTFDNCLKHDIPMLYLATLSK